MPTTFEIPVEPLTAAAFAPFGQLIGEQDGAPLFSGPGVKTWGVDFAIDGTLEIHYARFDHKDDMTFAMVERHFNVTQAFVPLDGAANVNVFAAPTAANDPAAIPRPEDMRAFYFDGGQGVDDVEGHLALRPISGAGAERSRRPDHGSRNDGGTDRDARRRPL